jgi:hypothetical protein
MISKIIDWFKSLFGKKVVKVAPKKKAPAKKKAAGDGRGRPRKRSW